jgi:hypothetical protein
MTEDKGGNSLPNQLKVRSHEELLLQQEILMTEAKPNLSTFNLSKILRDSDLRRLLLLLHPGELHSTNFRFLPLLPLDLQLSNSLPLPLGAESIDNFQSLCLCSFFSLTSYCLAPRALYVGGDNDVFYVSARNDFLKPSQRDLSFDP